MTASDCGRVGVGGEGGEAVVAITAGDCGPHHIAAGVTQGDGDTVDSILARILNAVAVCRRATHDRQGRWCRRSRSRCRC